MPESRCSCAIEGIVQAPAEKTGKLELTAALRGSPSNNPYVEPSRLDELPAT